MPESGSNRVNRGGSWNNTPRNVRASNRNNNTPENRNNNLGFRLASTHYTIAAGIRASMDARSVRQCVQASVLRRSEMNGQRGIVLAWLVEKYRTSCQDCFAPYFQVLTCDLSCQY